MKTVNVSLVGVGGQGIILTADLLAKTAAIAGYDVKKSEIHGMAPRGGSGRAIWGVIPFSFYNVSQSPHSHVFYAVGALVLGLVLMSPEIIASFKGKGRT